MVVRPYEKHYPCKSYTRNYFIEQKKLTFDKFYPSDQSAQPSHTLSGPASGPIGEAVRPDLHPGIA